MRYERGLKGDAKEVIGKMKIGDEEEEQGQMEHHSIRLCMYLSMS